MVLGMGRPPLPTLTGGIGSLVRISFQCYWGDQARDAITVGRQRSQLHLSASLVFELYVFGIYLYSFVAVEDSKHQLPNHKVGQEFGWCS